MSNFECSVVAVRVAPHPAADQIEIAYVGDFQSIVKKGQFKTGDLAVYLPEAAVLPEWLLKKFGFWSDLNGCGTLSGGTRNRVKAIKLRGVLSQGIVIGSDYPALARERGWMTLESHKDTPAIITRAFVEGDDAAEFLGVIKYEPVIPAQMAGRALGVNMEITHAYDFDNIKKNPTLFEEGEEIVLTEKIHGTLLQICMVPESLANEKFYRSRVVITSKGQGGRGVILDHNDESNVYAQAVRKFGLLDAVYRAFDRPGESEPFLLFGEVFGNGIQDLNYGSDLNFRAFDICKGVRIRAKFCPYDDLRRICGDQGIPVVPELYRGPYSREVLMKHTNGMEAVSGKGGHLREGVVIKTISEDAGGNEQLHPHYGRKIAKSVSEAYLMRKGNTTEFS